MNVPAADLLWDTGLRRTTAFGIVPKLPAI